MRKQGEEEFVSSVKNDFYDGERGQAQASCGVANPMEENERHALIDKGNNDTELKPELTNEEKFSGWVYGIIWLSILSGGIRGIINSTTVMMYSPVWGAVDLGLQFIGIISLGFLLLAKKWALYLWVGYLIAVSIINGYLSNNNYFPFAIVAAVKFVLMFLFLQIKKDGVSAWSIIFNNKKTDSRNNNVNASQTESEIISVGNSFNSDAIESKIEEVAHIETLNNGDNPSNESFISTEKGTIQFEKNIIPVKEESANENSNNALANTKHKGRKKK